jgi:hypothetical protein
MTITPMTGRDLHVDVPLSNVVVGRRPEGGIADQLLPVTPVDKQSNIFYRYLHGINAQHSAGRTERAPGTAAKKIHTAISSDTYFCKNYALGTDMVVEDVVNADEALDWANTNALQLTDRLMLDYEMRVAEIAVTSSNVGTTIGVATGFANVTGSRPIDVIEEQKELFRQRTGLAPNLAIIPEGVATYLRRNDQIRDVLFGDKGGLVNDADLARVFQIGKVLRPTVQVNTTPEGPTILGSWTYSDIWGNHIWLARVNLLQGRYVDTWLNAFRWTSPLLGVPFAVQRYPFDTKLKKYEMEIGYYQTEKVVSTDLAVRLFNVNSNT